MSFSYASADLSFTKASVSAGVGGRPVKSYVARRIKVNLSAAGAGERPLDSSLARMKASMGLRTHLRFLTRGVSGAAGRNAARAILKKEKAA